MTLAVWGTRLCVYLVSYSWSGWHPVMMRQLDLLKPRLLSEVAVLSVLAIVLVGCAGLAPVDLPNEQTPPPSQALVWGALNADHQDDWFSLLNNGPEALAWRLRAIDTATASIDLQTFLWTFDSTGSLVLDRLIAAADRGVRVKLLIDDTFLAGQDASLLELHHHPNIQYRVFNPFKRRANGGATRWALNLAEFHRLDHRMHNKAIIVDNRVAIVGGRNLADEYFGLHGAANFRDMELLVGGPIVKQLARTFDDYWNDNWSIPIDRLSHVTTSQADLVRIRHGIDPQIAVYGPESESRRLQYWRELIAGSRRGSAELLADRPPRDNPARPDEAPTQVAEKIVEIFEKARDEVVIVSAYLIPTERLESVVGRAIDRGVGVRILTNSISSNNHVTAHSAYRNHIHSLLREGAELHEVKSDAEDRHLYMLSPVETKALGLHAKALIIDDDKVFIGSANLDPRSLRINTEMGLMVESPELNADIRNAIRPDFDTANAWRLEFDKDGRTVWVSDDGRLVVQPATSFMQRIEDWFFSHLPLESEL